MKRNEFIQLTTVGNIDSVNEIAVAPRIRIFVNRQTAKKFPNEGIFCLLFQQHPSHEQLTPHGLQLQHSQGMNLPVAANN